MNDQLSNISPDTEEALDYEFHCITCSDQALPARVIEVAEATGMAMVEVQGSTTEVDINLVDDVEPGDMLLVHGGVALFMHTKWHTDA
jgi:hydrogenase assembly chaperone HypC/HupF